MIDPEHAKRVLEYQEGQPVMIIARWLNHGNNPTRIHVEQAEHLIELFVDAGYAIEPIEDDEL